MRISRRDIGSLVFVAIALAGIIFQVRYHTWRPEHDPDYKIFVAITVLASCAGMVWTLWGKTRLVYVVIALCGISIAALLFANLASERICEEIFEGPFFLPCLFLVTFPIPAAAGLSALYGIWRSFKTKDNTRIAAFALCAYCLLIAAGFYLFFTTSFRIDPPPDADQTSIIPSAFTSHQDCSEIGS